MNGPFEVIGGGEDLSVESRACLLRAARRQLRTLQAELYRFQQLPPRHAAGVMEATQAEIDCLSLGINWLWQTRPPP